MLHARAEEKRVSKHLFPVVSVNLAEMDGAPQRG